MPGDAGYEAARHGYFTLYDHHPAAIAGCVSEADVQACVDFASQHDIPVAARSGGHSYVGYSTVDGGLVVDVGRLDGIRVLDHGRAVVGAGARLGPVYQALGSAGRALAAGMCPTVGVVGLTLGGGVGVLGRKLGLTCDQLESARVVTADGVARTVSAHQHADLFWALRGGGGGSFVIVTSFTFRTAEAPDLTSFSLQFPPETAATLFAEWQDWQPRMPDELWSDLGLGATAANFGGCFVGPRSRLKAILDDFVRRVGAAPVKREEPETDFLGAMRYFAGCTDLAGPACGTGKIGTAAYVATSRMLMRPARDPAAVVALLSEDPESYTSWTVAAARSCAATRLSRTAGRSRASSSPTGWSTRPKPRRGARSGEFATGSGRNSAQPVTATTSIRKCRTGVRRITAGTCPGCVPSPVATIRTACSPSPKG